MSDLRELERLEAQFWRAPSAHNTQPWELTYGTERIELTFDPERALPAGDPTGRDLYLSLGAFVEAVLIVANDAGVSLRLDYELDGEGCRIGAFVSAAGTYDTPFTADDVMRRQTSRLAFAPERLDPTDLADASRQLSAGAELHEFAPRDLVPFVMEADRHLYESPDVVDEMRAWLRLTPRHPRYALDGLSYDCLGLTRPEAAAAAFLLRPRVFPVVRRFGLHRRFSDSTTKLLERGGSALVLVATAPSAAEVLSHGRGLMRIWLALRRRGVFTHPLSQIIDCPSTARRLAERVGADGEQVLLSVFRAGRSEPPSRSHRLR